VESSSRPFTKITIVSAFCLRYFGAISELFWSYAMDKRMTITRAYFNSHEEFKTGFIFDASVLLSHTKVGGDDRSISFL